MDENSSERPFTAADQAKIDSFTASILAVAEMWDGPPDVIVLGFCQTLGSLMRRNLQQDPARLAQYQHWLEMLGAHVEQSVPVQTPRRES